MIGIIKTTLTYSNTNLLSFILRLFHSTLPLERNFWESSSGRHNKGKRRKHVYRRSDKLCNPFQQCFRCPWSFLRHSDRHVIEELRKGNIFPGICKDPNHENEHGYPTRHHESDYECDYSTESESEFESDCWNADLVPDRLALGLNPSGPLKLEDVKIAYRTCAKKWHPDHHQGSSKVMAEEKFKRCNEAYQSLCDKLAEN